MAKVVILFLISLVAITVSAKPTTEDDLIAELKRILLDGDADSSVDTPDQLDDDEQEKAKEEEMTKEMADGGEKGNDGEIGDVEGGELGGTGEQKPGEGAEQNAGVEGELENTEEENDQTGLQTAGEQGEESLQEAEKPAVQGLLHQGWDMLDDLQRVSVALYAENHPVSDNKTPRDALHDVLVQMFEFDGLTDTVITNLLKRLSPSTDMCSEMFSEDEERTLERVTNCFIMRFTQLLSLVERLEQVSSISDLKTEDLIRLSTLERDLFRVSFEVFKVLKREDPSVSLAGIIGDKAAALAVQEGNLLNSGPKAGASQAQPSTVQEQDGDEEGTDGEEGGGTGNEEENGIGEQVEGRGEDEEEDTNAAGKRFLKKDFISRLAKKLEGLVRERYER